MGLKVRGEWKQVLSNDTDLSGGRTSRDCKSQKLEMSDWKGPLRSSSSHSCRLFVVFFTYGETEAQRLLVFLFVLLSFFSCTLQLVGS